MLGTKKNLNKAFQALRKAGYNAKQNLMCCQSCAWSSMTDQEAEKAVFYHRQDADDLKETGECYLSWSGNGKEIVRILKENDIKVDWEGSDDKRIKIKIEIS
jgi:hypothetical protein